MEKIHIIFILLLLLINTSHKAQGEPAPQYPIVINFSTPVTQHQQNQMDVAQISEHKVIHTIDFNLTKSLEPFIESCKQKSSSLLPWIDSAIENKGKTIIYTLCACYCYFYYEVCQANTLLNQATSWCNWKQTVMLQHLTGAKYDDLIQELLIDIQKKYFFSSDNKFQAITHDHLIQELLYEKKALYRYQSILNWSKKIYISGFLPLHFTYETIAEKLARLDLIIDLLSTWQSKQNYIIH